MQKLIQIFYFGNPVPSPFELKKLDKQEKEEGIWWPRLIPKESFLFQHKRRPTLIKDLSPEQQMSVGEIPKENCFEFVQVECGQMHTLLLNSNGDVFSFGQGLCGQLGTYQKTIQ